MSSSKSSSKAGLYGKIEGSDKREKYSMKIKDQTRKLAAGCSKHCFEVADGS
ncbi:hypothetical protein [Streptococcus pneumoniae]|uniref:hypothetical protein n=1 Tax=Streptococcus pneumoniae TaxID=1313 RepID=UPI001C5D3845|nr:hypothetical protein [Streptococcus pneumoniae]